ncbi:hypothetical protein NEMBOFW57_001752 [Staphylotrichum longicolle]|uniref:CFEM domain-containing protein n=1 Tax=Staphylotrichum longicolle TaxID=669026 RepID=A0AAD4F225_9PEZI|nr:hypothetical protein NEMBOFW57_001752 [Staphylotrichum longicolle]
MKTFVPILALAAGVTATFNRAPPFTCPGNTDNKCTDKQRPGFSWDDLDFGDFFNYRDFNFNGWKCEDDGGNRGRFAPRTGKKVIGGTCSSDKKKSPSFGCGAAVDKFSLGSIHVKPEFDCDLEFHYDMPDGSTCKHRSACRKSGTTVVNKQCGGAKNVTIVFPPQPNKPKPSCSIQVPTISFDCSTASSTKPPRTTTTKPATTKPPVIKTTTSSEVKDSTTTAPGQSSSSTPVAQTSSTVAPGGSTTTVPGATSTAIVPGTTSTTTAPGQESSTSPAQESSTSPAQESSTSPAQQSSSTSAEETSETTSVSPATSSPVTKTITTSFDSTSTIFTTSTQTITSCAPTVTNCPANSVVTTVVTIAVSTTICPVTETRTTVESQAPSSPATSAPAGATTSTPVSGGTSAVVSSAKPVETLPCPSVVPSCLNTFLFTVGCSDNTDAACYCPDATFVKNVYDCLYAHGETDSIIAEAVAYFQGICGKHVNENPAIATGATVTTYITVTAAPTVAPVYTTVIVDVTTVVPCTNDAGEVIPSSSTTVTVSTSLTVPQVDFTTGSSGSVDVIPITAAPVVTGTPGTGSGGVITSVGSTVTRPTGTGSLRPTTSSPVVIAGSGRVGASFGLAAVVAFLAAVAL